MTTEHDPQRIARLTPLADVLARIGALVKPVAPREVDVGAAAGRVNATEWRIGPRPRAAVAIRDGWAVRSDTTADASSYAPMPLSGATRIDAGERLPDVSDAVAPLDTVTDRGGRMDIVAPVAPGEGVLPVGGDAEERDILMAPGRLIRPVDAAVLAAAGIERTAVREPRVCVVRTRPGPDAILDAARGHIVTAVAASGGAAVTAADLAVALTDSGADAIVAIGGTGSGRNDAGIRTLAGIGRVEMHGIALLPGETAAFGMVGAKPVLLVPGRIDAALAVWVTIGRPMLARLCACTDEPPGRTASLSRKVVSPLGFTEVVPVRCRDGKVESIASGYWPLSAVARSDGWIMVPADSEGYPAGAEVVLRPWP